MFAEFVGEVERRFGPPLHTPVGTDLWLGLSGDDAHEVSPGALLDLLVLQRLDEDGPRGAGGVGQLAVDDGRRRALERQQARGARLAAEVLGDDDVRAGVLREHLAYLQRRPICLDVDLYTDSTFARTGNTS